MTKEQLALILGGKIIGYHYQGHQLIMSADLGNGVSIEIRLDEIPVSMAADKQDAANYIATCFLDALNNGDKF